MFDTGLRRDTLETIGMGIGSDVTFCIAGGTCLAEGRGEQLTDLPPLPRCYFVICKPPYSHSTPELFKRVKCEKIRARPDTRGMVAELMKGGLSGVARRMYNVFEDFLPYGTSDIADIKYALLDFGALGATMTGSGPAVAGLFDSITLAQKACEQLKLSYAECYLAETVDKTQVNDSFA
jgi:4-diphosphocytidyl-2-C-methyl-D-erythritol kinase